ncbi:BCD family MFS transporter [Cyanobium sp. Morenito 9A2]|nr:BCD family MFS transporter [Cyanobium sp. Morenito 9A2]
MITELGLPALLVGGALAFEQFMAPSRVLFGQMSDARPLGGRHRTPYIWIGTVVFAGLAVLAVPMIFQVAAAFDGGTGADKLAGAGGLCLLFATYGIGISLATTPYLALVIDRTSELDRPRAVSVIWSMLTVGIVVGAISISLSLKGLDGVTDPGVLQPVLLSFMAKAALIVVVLTVVATWGLEPPRWRSPLSRFTERDDAVTLAQAWRLVRASRQVLIFFLFLVLFTLGLFLQDPILESYGAEVFALPIAATASLNALWGVGTLVGLLLAGLVIAPRLGKFGTARLGCRLIIATLLLLVVAGSLASVPLLRVVMVFFGLAAGIGTNGALCLMLDLTLPEVAGTFVGVWGLAQALSRAVGKVAGGALLDFGRWVLPGHGPYGPYALVLLVEVLVAFGALLLLERVNLQQFRQDTGRSLSNVLSLELG